MIHLTARISIKGIIFLASDINMLRIYAQLVVAFVQRHHPMRNCAM